MPHIISDLLLHCLDAAELCLDFVSVSEPDFSLSRAESRCDCELHEVLRQRVVHLNSEVTIVSKFIVDQSVLGVWSAHLVSEHATAASFCIHLGVVEASYLVEGDLTISIEDQDRQ